MNNERNIGDTGYLKVSYLGYHYCEIVGFEHATGRIIIELASGKQITVYDDELE
jgi:hypothetical protein